MFQFKPVDEAVLEALIGIVGAENVSTAVSERQLRSQDMSRFPPSLSEVVVWPETGEQTAAVLRVANDHAVPVTAWGIGSSLEGHPIPLHGGISLSMEKMTAITAVHADDFQVTVQPGIGYKDLNAHLAQYGLFFPPDPGANATIGGMLANNAAGIRTVKYGASKDNVLAMKVALADGRLIRVGSRSIKQAAGYDLLHLFVGSEGTLGIITEAVLKLTPVPNLMSAVVATFPSVETAVEAVVAVRGSGLDVAALEFLGGGTAALLTREGGVDFGNKPTLLMEIHAAHEQSVTLDMGMIEEICEELGAITVHAASDADERRELWRIRHDMFEIARRAYADSMWQLMDVAVPISAYPEMAVHVTTTLAQYNLDSLLVGHAGDGNLHVIIPFKDEAVRADVEKVNKAIVQKAIALGGTSTGEHGVGIGKAPYLRMEHGAGLDIMYAIKQTLDPKGILNPGKIFVEQAR